MKLRTLLCAVFMAALVAAGCGDDAGSDDNASAPTTTTAAADSPSTPTDAPDDSDGNDTPGDAAGLAANCQEFAVAMQQAAASSAGVAATGTDLEASVAQLRAFADASPDAIKEDITLVYEGYAKVAEALAESGYDPTSGKAPTAEQIAAIQAASATLGSADYTSAAQRVSEWVNAGCTN